MKKPRMIRNLFDGTRTVEGAGVQCTRYFGSDHLPVFDPFLLLDDFSSSKAIEYIRGFPWHPHRGIETVTYIIDGALEHSDSLNNQGIISAGDIQWMTAGSGIIHQEMLLGNNHHTIKGFQLWINMPADVKMNSPRYQSIHAGQIPHIHLSDKSTCRVIAGSFDTIKGPAITNYTDTVFFDISLSPHTEFVYATPHQHSFFSYIFEGQASFGLSHQCESDSKPAGNNEDSGDEPLHVIASPEVVSFTEGDFITVATEKKPARFILVGGRPLKESVAWYGPIVMNTEEQLQTAFEEFQIGTFLKHSGKPVMNK